MPQPRKSEHPPHAIIEFARESRQLTRIKEPEKCPVLGRKKIRLSPVVPFPYSSQFASFAGHSSGIPDIRGFSLASVVVPFPIRPHSRDSRAPLLSNPCYPSHPWLFLS